MARSPRAQTARKAGKRRLIVSLRPWQKIASAHAPDGTLIELTRRGAEYLIRAGGYDLMSSEDEGSGKALAAFGCPRSDPDRSARILIGGLGMGYTLREALERSGPRDVVEVAELVPDVVEWNRGELGALADFPLRDPRTELWLGDVSERIASARGCYDAILLDVDNGPDALAHDGNDGLYAMSGLESASRALTDDGVLGVWSFSDDPAFTGRLENCGFRVSLKKVAASRKGRGKHHFVWIAAKGGSPG